jgi:hypothetical protein
MPVMVGGAIYTKLDAEAAVPAELTTDTTPVAPPATSAVMVVELTTVKDEAGTPLKVTAVAPVKLVPVMVTVVPAPPVAGVNEVMAGTVAE